jgi:hypothetical protein
MEVTLSPGLIRATDEVDWEALGIEPYSFSSIASPLA